MLPKRKTMVYHLANLGIYAVAQAESTEFVSHFKPSTCRKRTSERATSVDASSRGSAPHQYWHHLLATTRPNDIAWRVAQVLPQESAEVRNEKEIAVFLRVCKSSHLALYATFHVGGSKNSNVVFGVVCGRLFGGPQLSGKYHVDIPGPPTHTRVS